MRYSPQGPWLVIGDFNTVWGAHEKQGGIVNTTSCMDFNSFSDRGILMISRLLEHNLPRPMVEGAFIIFSAVWIKL